MDPTLDPTVDPTVAPTLDPTVDPRRRLTDDCSQSWGAIGRATLVGSGLAGLQEGIPFFMRRYSIWPFIACPVYEVPLEPVVIGVPRFPTVLTPNRGPEFDPADFEVPDVMEGAPEVGEIATGAGEVEAGAAAAEGAAAGWGVLEGIAAGILLEG